MWIAALAFLPTLFVFYRMPPILETSAAGVYVGYMGSEFPTGDYILTFETEGKLLTVNAKH